MFCQNKLRRYRKLLLSFMCLFIYETGFSQQNKLPADYGYICVVPDSSQWKLSLDKLVKKTSSIVIGELISRENSKEAPTISADFPAQGDMAMHGYVSPTVLWSFKISESIKGNLNAGDLYTMRTYEKKSEGMDTISYPFCHYSLRFDKNKKYLIFVSSFHPDGYREIKDQNDSFFIKVKNLVAK